MAVREATTADAKRIAETAEDVRMGTEEEFVAAILSVDSAWSIDDAGRFCQIERKPNHTTISVGPLLPLDMGDDAAMALLKDCIHRAYRAFPSERGWEIKTYIPPGNRHAADSFEAWFRSARRNLPDGAVILSLPTMEIAHERSQAWLTP